MFFCKFTCTFTHNNMHHFSNMFKVFTQNTLKNFKNCCIMFAVIY